MSGLCEEGSEYVLTGLGIHDTKPYLLIYAIPRHHSYQYCGSLDRSMHGEPRCQKSVQTARDTASSWYVLCLRHCVQS